MSKTSTKMYRKTGQTPQKRKVTGFFADWSKRCPTCGFRIRGIFHANGQHHKQCASGHAYRHANGSGVNNSNPC